MEEKGIGRREVFGAAAAGVAALGVGGVASAAAAQEGGGGKEAKAQFCVLSHKALAQVHERSDKDILEAQRKIDDKMLSAMEEMVKAAKAGRLEGKAALGLACVAW
jgi:hypothetical protein